MNDAWPTKIEVADSKGQSVALERRGHPRVPCRYQALCRSAGRAWWPVQFVDLSLSGAGVLLAAPVEVGAEVTFTVHTSNSQTLVIQATVRRVETRVSEWMAGCEFDRLLTEQEFAALV